MLDVSLQEIAHLICCVLLHAGGDMRIGVQREACGEVSEDIGQRFHVYAVLESHSGERMTQIVEADAG